MSSERVHVSVRMKPPSSNDAVAVVAEGTSVIMCQAERRLVADASPERHGSKSFAFDAVFGTETNQEAVFNQVGLPVLHDVLEGYNGTIMAYGQTGSGKTHTLLQLGNGRSVDSRTVGLVPRTAAALFVAIEEDILHVYDVESCFLQVPPLCTISSPCCHIRSSHCLTSHTRTHGTARHGTVRHGTHGAGA